MEPDRDDALDALDTLDDATLRGIAYGRADSDSKRMRAERAARLLADREHRARTAEAPPSEAAPAPRRPDSVQPVDRQATADVVPPDTVDEVDADDDSAGWWTRGRKVGAALLVGGLVLGGVAGFGGERLIATTSPTSLSVFERAATEADTPSVDLSVLGLPGEARLLGTVGEAEVFAIRTSDGFTSGSVELGPHICVTAVETDLFFPQPACVPESVFEVAGLAGAVTGITFAETSNPLAPPAARVISVSWGPRGDATLVDATEAALAAAAGEYSPEQRALGADLPIVQVMVERGADERMQRVLSEMGAPPTFGPLPLGVIFGETGVTVDVFASVHEIGEGPLTMCLSVLVDQALYGDGLQCIDLADFRSSGMSTTVQSPTASGYVRVSISPSSDAMFVDELGNFAG